MDQRLVSDIKLNELLQSVVGAPHSIVQPRDRKLLDHNSDTEADEGDFVEVSEVKSIFIRSSVFVNSEEEKPE